MPFVNNVKNDFRPQSKIKTNERLGKTFVKLRKSFSASVVVRKL